MRNLSNQNDPDRNPNFSRDWGGGRPNIRLASKSRRDALELPGGKDSRAKSATSTEAARRFVGWVQAAAAESKPEARLAAFENGLAELQGLGVTPGDLLQECRR